MFNKSMLAIVTLTAATAQAQPEVDMSAGQTTPAAAAPVAVAGGAFQKGTLGISVSFTTLSNIADAVTITSEEVPTINVLYFMSDKAALDLIGGFNLHRQIEYDNSTPPVGMSRTNFGFALGAGYRMYSHKSDRLHTFMEPQAILSWPNLNDSASFQLEVLGVFGAEAMFTEWASLSAWIGLGAAATNKFDDLQLATTANLAANLYWK